MNYLDYYDIVKKRFSISEKAVKRFHHQEEVVKMALYLNQIHQLGVDIEKIKIAGILHDYCKIDDDTLCTKKLEKYLGADALRYQAYPMVAHGILASFVIQEELGISDPEIIDAIYYHTTGKPQMSRLTQLIYVADTVEATRNYPGVDELRQCVIADFDKGTYCIIKAIYEYLMEKQLPIEENTKNAYLYYKEIFDETK